MEYSNYNLSNGAGKINLTKEVIQPPKSNRLTWIFLVAAIVIVFVVFFVFSNCKDKNAHRGEPSVEQNELIQTDEEVETIETEEETTPLNAPASGNAQSSQSATPAAKTQSSKTGKSASKTQSRKTAKSASKTQSRKPAKSASKTQSSQTAKRTAIGKVASSTPLQGTLDKKARRVIRGDFGNGKVRKQKLGREYKVIQRRVNEMYRKGLVK